MAAICSPDILKDIQYCTKPISINSNKKEPTLVDFVAFIEGYKLPVHWTFQHKMAWYDLKMFGEVCFDVDKDIIKEVLSWFKNENLKGG